MRIGTTSPKRGKYHNLDVGIMKINLDEFEKYGRIDLALESTRNHGLTEYPQYTATLSENEIKELTKAMAGTNQSLDSDSTMNREDEKYKNMLEDVVNELDLSNSAIEQHGALGTPPAELVRLVLEEKDKIILRLKSGLKPIAWKEEV